VSYLWPFYVAIVAALWVFLFAVIFGARLRWIGAVMTTAGLGLGLIGVLAVSLFLLRVTRFDRDPADEKPIHLAMSRRDLFWGRIGVTLIICSALLQFAGAWLPQEMGD